MTSTSFTQLMSAVSPTDTPHIYQAQVTEDWLQGRTTFGGMSAALAITALRADLKTDRPLRGLLTSFIGPAGIGELTIECIHLRSGRSVTWAEARISQNGKLCTTLTASFGDGRDSVIAIASEARPDTPAPDSVAAWPYIPNVTPAFTQHFEIHQVIGQFPATGSSHGNVSSWVRFRDPQNFGEPHIVALMDLLPPGVLQMFPTFKPVSSLTWQLQMLDNLDAPDACDGEGWFYIDVTTHSAANGYSVQNATLYTPTGRALAMSQQVITIFA